MGRRDRAGPRRGRFTGELDRSHRDRVAADHVVPTAGREGLPAHVSQPLTEQSLKWRPPWIRLRAPGRSRPRQKQRSARPCWMPGRAPQGDPAGAGGRGLGGQPKLHPADLPASPGRGFVQCPEWCAWRESNPCLEVRSRAGGRPRRSAQCLTVLCRMGREAIASMPHRAVRGVARNP